MTAACTQCGDTFTRAQSPVCPACRYAARLEKQRLYEAARRAEYRAWLQAQPAEVREEHRQAELAEQRARYRRSNPLPPCVKCGKPCARANQHADTCDACAGDREARIAKRARTRLAYWRRRGGKE